MSLADSYVVHTKIYPRYQSRKNVAFARDAFSNWLTPHESDNTDVILIGHSLGGILAAEVVLLPSNRPGSMHPGVVSTGIASLFRSTPGPPESPAPTSDSNSAGLSTNPFEFESSDPNYNPAFPNDVRLPVRATKLDQAFYFLNKHYGDWRKATTSYIKSHLEFGGCLADYEGLKKRYRSFRPLEDVDDLSSTKSPSGKLIPRVRFVNYYTASTGRIKPQPNPIDDKVLVAETEMAEMKSSKSRLMNPPSPQSNTPRVSLQEHRDSEIVSKRLEDFHLEHPDQEDEDVQMQHLEPQAEPPSPVLVADEPTSPIPSEFPTTSNAETASITPSTISSLPLPPLADPPVLPTPFDPTPYTSADQATLKLARKEHERQMKAYERSKKDYEKSVRDREKHIAKLEKARQKQEEKETAGLSAHEKSERERLTKEAERMQKEKERMEKGSEKEDPKRAATLNQGAYDAALSRQQMEQEDANFAREEKLKAMKLPVPPKSQKKQKDRKFCTLPSKDSKTGRRDPTWIRVYMENMDEVVAHTSLFFVSETYAKLVGDTAERIEEWVRDAANIRAVREAQDWE
ncbi:hypothetical protein LTR64_006482 [Lithohypha guttulata]|uniref:uncharacterized protein n=1 Tax=Lithohypha guttulata TaxID=1690604 RepID=UPI002DDFD6E9|nr:hypothetical protein LTR51_004960 [Lithohypha guttulata]